MVKEIKDSSTIINWILSKEWEFIIQRKAPIISFYLGMKMVPKINEILDVDFKILNMQFRSGKYFISQDDATNILEFLNNKVSNDINFLFILLNKAEKKVDALKKFIESNIKNNSQEDLINIISTYFEMAAEAYAYFRVVLPLADLLHDDLLNRLKKQGLSEEFVLKNVSLPYKDNYIIKSQRELKQIFEIFKKEKSLIKLLEENNSSDIIEKLKKENKQIFNRIEEYRKRFGWMQYLHFYGNDLTLVDVVNGLKNIPEKIESISKETLDVSKKDIEKVDLLQKAIFLRTHIAEITSAFGSYYIKKLLEPLSKKLNIDSESLLYLLPEELIKSIKEKKVIVDMDELNKRKKDYGLFLMDGEMVLITGPILDEINEAVDTKPEEEIGQIQGRIGYQGIVKGKVKIILSESDFPKLEKGDILVAPMTTPNYVLIMHKASAFITDEGGITCHAAIVAREMGKPCVIGTKIATKVLKNGDLVEVDGHEGIVHILKRK